MSFYFRDKPRFSDRLRSDNSGDDLMESLKRQFDQDSKTFFEPSSTSSRISREREPSFDHRYTGFSRGFPFDDDGFERRGNIRSHLDDLAARHPEFADQLLGPPWGDAPFSTNTRNRRKGSGLGSYQGHQDDDTRSQASGSSAASAASGASGVSSHGEPEHYSTSGQDPHINVQDQRKHTIPQYGLRNTVDIGQHRHNMDNNNEKMNRGQRSASAPPENRQQQPQQNFEPQQQQQPQSQNQRYVSRVDITPQQQHGDIPKRPMSPKQNQPQQTPPPQPQQTQQQKAQPQGNVRHIPIFVEGRDEPVIPKNVEETVFPQQQQQQRAQSPPQFHRPSHFNQHFANSRQWPPQYHQQQQFHHQPHHEQQNQPQQTQKPNHYEQQQQQYRQQQAEKQRAQQQQQQQQQQQEQQEAEPAPKLKQIQPKEPLERVALVQQEVDSLMEQVKLYNGNSRREKQYMYLDEMLTRELIKLDDIETEGKPNVRQARKDAIKSIQDCIGLLESKVPLPGQEDKKETTNEEAEKSSTLMETDITSVGSEQPEVSPTVPIPLPPPAPSAEQNLTTEESVAIQGEGTTTDDSTSAQVASAPLDKTGSVTAMETQQDAETQKRQAESSIPSLEPVESGSEQQLNVDNEAKAVKSPRKERKTIPPKPVSEQPIPLPAPEVCHT